MIVDVKDLEQRTFSPVGSEASFDGRFVSSFGENQPTQYVERREAGVGSSIRLPFQAGYNSETGQLSAAGGWWMQAPFEEWFYVPPAASTGSFAYLVIDQNDATVVTDVSIEIRSAAYEEILDIDPDPPGRVLQSRVLLAEVISGILYQRRHGNFSIGLWQIHGDIARWPETVVGSADPLAPPPIDPDP